MLPRRHLLANFIIVLPFILHTANHRRRWLLRSSTPSYGGYFHHSAESQKPASELQTWVTCTSALSQCAACLTMWWGKKPHGSDWSHHSPKPQQSPSPPSPQPCPAPSKAWPPPLAPTPCCSSGCALRTSGPGRLPQYQQFQQQCQEDEIPLYMVILLVNFGRDAVVAHAGLKKDQQQNGDHQKGLFKTN